MAWGNASPNVSKAYNAAFGDLPEGTVYSGYDKSFSKRYETDALKKHVANVMKTAISDMAAGTAGVVGVPIYLDRDFTNLVAKETPVRALLRSVTNKGRSADYDRITAKPTAAWETENASATVSKSTTETKNKAIKYLRVYGNVTGPLFAASKERMAEAGLGDYMNFEVQQATQDLIEEEEDTLINGNMETTDANKPKGILKEIVDNGNSTDKNTAGDLTISALDEMVRICQTANDSATYAGAMPNLAITDLATENKIKGLFYDAYRVNAPTQTWGWGMNSAIINGVPVLGSKFMTAASGERNLAMLNTNFIEKRVLQDITYEDLAKTNDSDTFMVKEYLTVVVKAPEFMNVYYNMD